MIRRPKQDVMLESGSDKDWEMPSSTLPNVFTEAKIEAALNGHDKGTRKTKTAEASKKPSRAGASKAKAGRR